MNNFISNFSLCLLCVLLGGVYSFAAVCNWTGSADANWATASNWDCGVVPSSTDDVLIPLVANLPIISTAVPTVQSIVLASGATLIIDATGTLTVDGNNVTATTISVNANAMLINNGSLTVTNHTTYAILDYGTIYNNGNLDLPNNVGFGIVVSQLFNTGTITSTSVDNFSIYLSSPSSYFENTGTVDVDVIGVSAGNAVNSSSITCRNLYNNGTNSIFTNNAGGNISISNLTTNYGLLTNNGTITTESLQNNGTSSQINNANGASFVVAQTSVTTNQGNISNTGGSMMNIPLVLNSGSVINEATMIFANFTNFAGSSLINNTINGTVSVNLLINEGQIVNDIGSTATITILTNNATGIVINNGTMSVDVLPNSVGLILNETTGTFNMGSDFDVIGSIINNGYWNAFGRDVLSGGAAFINNGLATFDTQQDVVNNGIILATVLSTTSCYINAFLVAAGSIDGMYTDQTGLIGAGFYNNDTQQLLPDFGTPLGLNTYYIAATVNGVTQLAPVLINIQARLNALAISVPPITCGTCTSAVTLTAFNGTVPYTYTIGSTTNTTGSFNVPVGFYNISATDAIGCSIEYPLNFSFTCIARTPSWIH